MKSHASLTLQMLPNLMWPTSFAWLQASGTLTETSAKQLLLQWQIVKADALGNHALGTPQLRQFAGSVC